LLTQASVASRRREAVAMAAPKIGGILCLGDDPMSPTLTVAKRRDANAWRMTFLALCLALLLLAAFWGASLMSDSGRIPSELAAAAQQPGEMICSGGAIVRGDGSLVDSMFGAGRFRCMAWRMRHRLVDPATGATDWPSSPRR
jgi:hypothetical protein